MEKTYVCMVHAYDLQVCRMDETVDVRKITRVYRYGYNTEPEAKAFRLGLATGVREGDLSVLTAEQTLVWKEAGNEFEEEAIDVF